MLITYNWFLPAFKAGGPIQSLANLVRQTSDEYSYYILCSNQEYNEDAPLQDVVADQWVDFEGKARVYYLSRKNTRVSNIKRIIRDISPDVIFANGMFSLPFAIAPLLCNASIKIFSARGMFHPGALSQKKWKKKLFLALFRVSGLDEKVVFHATDLNEKAFIEQRLGSKVVVKIAGNFPRIVSPCSAPPKHAGALVLGSISLISPMKNHLLVIRALANTTAGITYNIYGPVKDPAYWDDCRREIDKLPANVEVRYLGDMPPAAIETTMQQFHYFILPSKSENFGHAIFEALTAGRPVITSFNTPWNKLAEHSAGANVDIEKIDSITRAIETAAAQHQDEYEIWQQSARDFALKSVDVANLREDYRALFN